METPSHILSVAVPRPLDGLFTYKLPDHLLPLIEVGGWVKVPFGTKSTYAFVVESPKPISQIPEGLTPEMLKEILDVGEPRNIFSSDVLALCRWANEYYFSPLGEVLSCAAPPAALGLKNARSSPRTIDRDLAAFKQVDLTSDQKSALEKLIQVSEERGTTKVALLHGVTGSGKTELYLELARRTLSEKKGVLLLVPEIALTSQLHQRLEGGLGVPVALWHSAVANGKRRDESAALRSGKLRVAVGARSAIFAPVKDLGLIIIDEEHDPTYKQDERVKYHARDLAIVRSKISGALVVLGSATPSIETRERVIEGKYQVAELKQRISQSGLPSIEVVDLRTEEKVEGVQALLAHKTIQAIEATIAAGEQAIIFLNRRGFASFLICQDCGEVKECPNCSISLTVHRRDRELRCHVCDHKERTPDFCSKCLSRELAPMGAGTESLEDDLPRLVRGMIPLRLDRDQVTSATRLDSILGDFRSGKANVLLGTQMLVKGHDFPNVTLVVVVVADALFRWPDFRAPERAYQILRQVSGRAGRGDRPGRVLIQTFNPDHPVIQTVQGIISEDSFYETERQLRRALGYPPFGRMARLRFESRQRKQAQDRSVQVVRALKPLEDRQLIELLGPSEAFLERAKGTYRWDILIKSPHIQGLQRAVKTARDVCQQRKWLFLVDVDPYGVG